MVTSEGRLPRALEPRSSAREDGAHGEHERRDARGWLLDPFSSGLAFSGWKELERQLWRWRPPDDYVPLPVALPRTWLLRAGWRRAGAISLFDVPGA